MIRTFSILGLSGVVLSGLFFFVPYAYAATLLLVPEKISVNAGEPVHVSLILDTEGESVNALEAGIIFPSEGLVPESVQDGNSIIGMWVQRPDIIEGSVQMAGIIPAGFTGRGVVATAVFKGVKEGTHVLSLGPESKALLNSAESQMLPLVRVGTSLVVLQAVGEAALGPSEASEVVQAGSALSDPSEASKDLSPPERFDILIEQTPVAFEGEWFASFGTQDKGSGIAYYEVREIPLGVFGGRWERGQSPYVLKRQNLPSVVSVKAVDFAGHAQVEYYIPNRLMILYIILAAALVVTAAFVLTRNIKKKILELEYLRGLHT